MRKHNQTHTGKLPFSSAPKDDRALPELQLALYNDVVVFDQVHVLFYLLSVILCTLNVFQSLPEMSLTLYNEHGGVRPGAPSFVCLFIHS